VAGILSNRLHKAESKDLKADIYAALLKAAKSDGDAGVRETAIMYLAESGQPSPELTQFVLDTMRGSTDESAIAAVCSHRMILSVANTNNLDSMLDAFGQLSGRNPSIRVRCLMSHDLAMLGRFMQSEKATTMLESLATGETNATLRDWMERTAKSLRNGEVTDLRQDFDPGQLEGK
jgi:hypothetical protein